MFKRTLRSVLAIAFVAAAAVGVAVPMDPVWNAAPAATVAAPSDPVWDAVPVAMQDPVWNAMPGGTPMSTGTESVA